MTFENINLGLENLDKEIKKDIDELKQRIEGEKLKWKN